MDSAARDFPPGDLRVSDADRDRAFSPSPGFDWAGTLTPAAIAVLFVVLIIFVRVTRPGRP